MDLNLTGKNALVCGSTQGIGKAAALELAQMGASVTLVARNEERLQEALTDLDRSKGQQHDYLCADFSSPETLATKLGAYLANDKTIHILINNTGGPPGGPIAVAGIDQFRAAFEMHLICNHILVTAVKEGMQKAGYGRIINVISTSVKQPLNGLGVSNTIRGAVANWAKTMANELGIHGITVNNVLPGATNTVRLQSIIENKAQKQGKTIEEVSQAMKSTVPAGRFAEANEVANAIAFLASPAAAYINGINVPVDGGRTKCL
ncbi:SDR family oxidoreductase [Aureispira anguillae]|uniref:SDR family oxidoreductase n=1 Tax=Aureispira anguillae TaxID=2864201 RepID=A0A916DR68_9BACT|nr:SDR family oxidoreductase [Aureispira anguillae]BDS10480.1 SDR family oxidoreductase [Aureispira anguillae]